MTLGGFAGANKSVRVTVAGKSDRDKFEKPHRAFRNWRKYFSLPWMCFLDVAVFVLYLLFGYYHQSSAITFTLDFSQAIEKFFLADIDMPETPVGIPVGAGQLFFVSDFLDTVNLTCQRLFAFRDNFPVAFPFLMDKNALLEIVYMDGQYEEVSFPESGTDQILAKIEEVARDFDDMTLSMNYHIQVTAEAHDSRMNLAIAVDFTNDRETDTIFLDVSHTRFQEKLDLSAPSVLLSLDDSLPISIVIFNFIQLLIMVRVLYSLSVYAKDRASRTGLSYRSVFWKKFDKWDVFAILSYTMSIIACIMYIFVGKTIEEEVPPILYVMSCATCLHSLLMIRYLKLKESTMLIMTVFYKSAIKILQFLIGCLPIYLGFLAFGICFFGHLDANFASGMQAASFLFCVMHGDSIKDMYDSVIIQNDMSVYVGFIYTSCWLAFSLLIMFNITISIVQEVLTVETYKLQNTHENENDVPAFAGFQITSILQSRA